MEDYKIRKFVDSDTPQMQELIKGLWLDDMSTGECQLIHEEHGPSEFVRESYTVELNGEAIAFGSIYENNLHYGDLFLAINVRQDWQRKGIATELLNLFNKHTDKKCYTVKTSLKSESSIAFLKKNGFKISTHSATGVVDTDKGLSYLKDIDLPMELSFRKEFDRQEMADFFSARYREDHFWVPCEELSQEDAMSMFMGENVIEGSVISITKDDKLVAASNLMSIVEGEAYWVWYGVDNQLIDEDFNQRLYKTLLKKSLEFCKEKGLKLFFEADSVNGEPYYILEAIMKEEFDDSFTVWTRDINS
jgi:GNAT superfamily N-acetyltransferase